MPLTKTLGGDKIAARIEAILGMVNRPDLVLNYDRPITANSHRNVLRTTASTPTSRRTPKPKS